MNDRTMVVGLAVGGLCAGALAACSQPAQPTQPARQVALESTTVAAAETEASRCLADQLSGEVRVEGAAAGTRYGTLVVTNIGAEPCTLYGYGGLELVGPDRRSLPTDLQRVDPGPQEVRLAPGERAGKDLRWGVVPGEGEPATEPCQPKPDHVDVIPPDGTEQFSVPWPAGPVCQHGQIEGSAYHPL
ncbi:Protein of unknown function [Amycolatopsis arida]|uniref:DUF4232 domain-containing protein n=1 Tax=Amycolatopsis arida TaxID=587909 RepID=A0A1I5LPZ1_9PSEU|nr:DUF4232 domain-containing protein [Amycolatopsis arida]TDX93799.1 uncharacterized protein DUF4232 [Amycolatopsis arida]SFO99388.1 Protein of unknown function [Amycolatopsis arida]